MARRRSPPPPAVALAAALAGGAAVSAGIVAVLVTALGGDPGRALAALHAGSVATPGSLADTLLASAPLLLTGLAAAVAFRCGLWNIGAEGQFLLGMLGAAAAALALPPMPPMLAAPLCLAAAAAAGTLWTLLPAALRLRRGVPEVISTIMLNFLAVYLLEYLVRGPMRDPGSIDEVGAALPEWTRLPRLGAALGWGRVGGESLRLPDGTPAAALGVDLAYLHAGVFLALLTAVLSWVWLARSGAGFRMRAVGSGPPAAAAAGISVARTLAIAFLVSGGLAGLAGGIEQLAAVGRLHRYAAGEPGYGFSGIAVALLGRLHPGGVLAAALFLGALRAGCEQMQRAAGVSIHVTYVVQAALVLLLSAGRLPLAGRRRPDPRPPSDSQ